MEAGSGAKTSGAVEDSLYAPVAVSPFDEVNEIVRKSGWVEESGNVNMPPRVQLRLFVPLVDTNNWVNEALKLPNTHPAPAAQLVALPVVVQFFVHPVTVWSPRVKVGVNPPKFGEMMVPGKISVFV